MKGTLVCIEKNHKDVKIKLAEFVKEFSKAYCIKEEKIEGIKYQQSLKCIEEMVLKGDFYNRADCARMLAWKMGKIKYSLCNCDDKEVKYAADWIGCEKENPLRYKKPLKIDSLLDNLNMIRPELDKKIKNGDINGSYELIKTNKVDGIGPVYIISILFFISKGKFPIYDRFARVALDSIDEGIKSKKGDSAKYSTITIDEYIDYKNKLDKLYKEFYNDEDIDYIRNRDLDRALWVYGHGY